MKGFLVFIGVLIAVLILNVYGWSILDFVFGNNHIPLNNEYTNGLVQDFCSISNINLYFKNRNECCRYKMSCGSDDKRGKWDEREGKCRC